MALLIDINDLAVRCYHSGELLNSAPGYALLETKKLTLGEPARQQSRLNPLTLHHEFWQKLSVQPLVNNSSRLRHNADIAHSQLQQLLQALPSELQSTPLIFCLPSSWDSAQLSLFLGLAQTFDHPVIGLVDSAVAALANHPHSHNQLYVEWHLHEVVISRVQQAGHELQRHDVETLANQGWQSLLEHLLRNIAQLFIQQLRFDPRQNAQTEQVLFNKLPNWIRTASQGQEQELSLAGQRISVGPEDLLQHLRSFLSPLTQRLQKAEQDSDIQQLVFSDRFSPIAPLLQRYHKSAIINEHHLAHSFEDLSQQLQQHPDGVHYLMKLPASSPKAQQPETTQGRATHLLCDGHAYPLSPTLYWSSSYQDHGLQTSPTPPKHFIAHLNKHELMPGTAGQLTLNGQPVTTPTQLLSGDVISSDQQHKRLQVIQVHASTGVPH